VFSATAIFASVLSVIVSAFLVLCLPTWASLAIVFALVAILTIGGETLLAKTLIVCALVALGVWLWRRYGPPL